MLLDRYRQLLTAYVDGELSSRQRRHVVRLLHRSAEARQLLQQLKADARALRQLPAPPLPADLTGPVLRLIAERNLTPSRTRIIKAATATAWIGPLASWAVAAAVLVALGVASYFCFVASLDQPAKTELVQIQPEPSVSTPLLEDRQSALTDEDDEIPEGTPELSAPKIERRAAVKPPKVARKNDDKPKSNSIGKQSPSTKQEAALADRVETFRFDRVPDLLPIVVKLSDLNRLPARKKFISELSKDTAFRLELPCANGAKAFERLQIAARRLHIGLIIDKPAQERLKLKWKISYAVYLEDILPEELTEFARQIEVEDHKSAAGKPAEVQLDRLVLTCMSAANRKELSALLGVDPTSAAPDATGPPGADPRKPLSDATARQVGQALAGQGGTPRPEPGKTAVQPAEHIALVLAYTPVRPSPGSDEIKHFLESRKSARPGTIRVLLVLRGS